MNKMSLCEDVYFHLFLSYPLKLAEQMGLSEVVIIDADSSQVTSPYEDTRNIPSNVVRSIKNIVDCHIF